MAIAQRRGFTLTELAVLMAVLALLLAMLIPMLAAGKGNNEEKVSANNLRQIGQMHVMYAKDWDGRQWTVTPDDLSVRLNFGAYPTNYPPDIAPPVPLGHDCSGQFWQTGRGWAIQPMWWPANCSIGNFRAWNTQRFNSYANNKVYDPLFWAPRDRSIENVQEYFDLPCEWPGAGTQFFFPTYCMSVAAQVDPEVYRGPSDGGSQQALDLPLGHQTPALASATYPDLKTHMLEHYWLNPLHRNYFIPGTGGVPWFYNMSTRSEPMTLFFDGSVRKLPVLEVLVSNHFVVTGGEDPLWADDPACFGTGGYFESFRADELRYHRPLVDETTSYHVFTRDGIQGRDTIFNK